MEVDAGIKHYYVNDKPLHREPILGLAQPHFNTFSETRRIHYRHRAVR